LYFLSIFKIYTNFLDFKTEKENEKGVNSAGRLSAPGLGLLARPSRENLLGADAGGGAVVASGSGDEVLQHWCGEHEWSMGSAQCNY
jgi:hypothetical protein